MTSPPGAGAPPPSDRRSGFSAVLPWVLLSAAICLIAALAMALVLPPRNNTAAPAGVATVYATVFTTATATATVTWSPEPVTSATPAKEPSPTTPPATAASTSPAEPPRITEEPAQRGWQIVDRMLYATEDAEALTEVPEGLRELLAQLLLPTPELDCATSLYVTEVHPDGWAHVNVDQEGCGYHWGIFADYGNEWFEMVSSDDGDYLCDELIALGVPPDTHTVECSG